MMLGQPYYSTFFILKFKKKVLNAFIVNDKKYQFFTLMDFTKQIYYFLTYFLKTIKKDLAKKFKII